MAQEKFNITKFIFCVNEMRSLQREYLKTKDNSIMKARRHYEQAVDSQLDEIIKKIDSQFKLECKNGE